MTPTLFLDHDVHVREWTAGELGNNNVGDVYHDTDFTPLFQLMSTRFCKIFDKIVHNPDAGRMAFTMKQRLELLLGLTGLCFSMIEA